MEDYQKQILLTTLSRSGSCLVRVEGTSMWPFIRGGDEAIIKRCGHVPAVASVVAFFVGDRSAAESAWHADRWQTHDHWPSRRGRHLSQWKRFYFGEPRPQSISGREGDLQAVGTGAHRCFSCQRGELPVRHVARHSRGGSSRAIRVSPGRTARGGHHDGRRFSQAAATLVGSLGGKRGVHRRVAKDADSTRRKPLCSFSPRTPRLRGENLFEFTAGGAP